MSIVFLMKEVHYNKISLEEAFMFKFCLIDDETDLIIGYCKDLIGINGKDKCIIDDKIFNKIMVSGFIFNPRFKL